MRKTIILGLALLAMTWSAAAWAEEQQIQGQRPIPVVEGAFKLQEGAWATYKIHDLKKNQRSRMYFATLSRVDHEGVRAMWMEIAVKPEGEQLVRTRILAEDTPKGPGRVLEVIVQPEGYDPFYVPQSFFADQGGDTADFEQITPQAKSQAVNITIGKRKFSGWRVIGQDQNGAKVEAVASLSVPPLGLVSSSTADVRMEIDEWGMGAKTLIKGEPVNFYLWLIDQIGKGMAEEPQK